MRLTTFTIGLFMTVCSCSNDKPADKTSDMLKAIRQVPDTVWATKDHRTNEFQFDLTGQIIDLKKTKTLHGEWIASSGQLQFLNTSIEPGDRVVFSDTIGKSGTGWGTIVYNREAKFYMAEAGSNVYDYFIDKDGLLNLVQYEYRNDDLSFKKHPEPIFKQLTINWTKSDQLDLTTNNQKTTLKRK